jgi:hypothetical protein
MLFSSQIMRIGYSKPISQLNERGHSRKNTPPELCSPSFQAINNINR